MWGGSTFEPPPGAGALAADDEARALDRREDLRLRLGTLERARSARGVVEVTDPAGVTRLDREDRARCAQNRLRLDVADLAEVGGDARVLEHLRRGHELRLVRRRPLEVEHGLLDGSGAESLLQERDVSVLMGGDDTRELPHLAGEPALRHRLVVEGRLEVLERQREVEDRDVAGGDGCRRHLRDDAEERAAADERACAQAGLAQKRPARVAVDVDRRLADSTVGVELFQAGKTRHTHSFRGGLKDGATTAVRTPCSSRRPIRFTTRTNNSGGGRQPGSARKLKLLGKPQRLAAALGEERLLVRSRTLLLGELRDDVRAHVAQVRS